MSNPNLESNEVPFEVITDDSADPRTGIELFVSPYDAPSNILDVIPRRMNPRFLTEIQRVGGGSFSIRTDDRILKDNPELLAFRNIVRCKVDQRIIGAFVIQRKTTKIVGTGEKAAEITEVAGEGLRTWLNDAVVHPYGGLKLHSASDRVFSFASEQGTWYNDVEWVTPAPIAQYSMTPPDEGNHSPWGTAPAEWPDAPLAWWVWGVQETAPDPGFCYFRYEFDLSVEMGSGDYSLFTSGDDEYEVYVDAGRVQEVKEVNAYSKTWQASFTLDPGHHVIAARVKNIGGAGGFIAAFFKVGDATADPPTAAVLLSYTGESAADSGSWNTDLSDAQADVVAKQAAYNALPAVPEEEKAQALYDLNIAKAIRDSMQTTVNWRPYQQTMGNLGWLVNPYPDPAPGWSPGEVMLTLLNEARARGVRMADHLIPTFSEDFDSDGIAWPRPLDWVFDIGASYNVVISKLEELVCDVWIDPSNFELNMAISQGKHRDVQVIGAQPIELKIGHNLVRAEEEGIAEMKNSLVMSVADGFESHADSLTDSLDKYGVLEGFLSGSSSSSVTGDVAQAIFGKYALPMTSASFKIVDRDEARPFRDFVEGDWLLAPNAAGKPESRRVMSISVAESDRTGKPDFEVEFDTILEDKDDRLERWLKVTSDGTLGGTVANSGGGGGTPTPSIPQPLTGAQGNTGNVGPMGPAGVNWLSEWSDEVDYVEHDAVSYLGSSFIAIADNTDTEPDPAGNAAWDVLALGAGIELKGAVPTTASLPASGNVKGDAYLVQSHLWVWSGSIWVDGGTVQGPKGDTGPKGTKGDPGAPGGPGMSAYDEAVLLGYVGTEAQWIASLEGPQGPVGDGLLVLGTLPNTGALPSTGNEPGDAYMIGSDVWVWDGSAWDNLGPLQGPKGDKGDKGDIGNTGASAYQVWLAQGNSGTEAQYIASLKGVKGDKGDKGDSAYQVWLSDGNTGTVDDFLAEIEGDQGPQGDGLIILGTLSDEASLPATGTPGNAYLIDGDLWIWSSVLSDWENVGPLIGAEGEGTGGGSYPVNSFVKTTGVLAPGETEYGMFTMNSAEVMNALVVKADKASRVRFYASVAQMNADVLRGSGQDPLGNHGVLLDTTLEITRLTQVQSPVAALFNTAGFPGSFPVAITNESGSSNSITITVTGKGLAGVAQGGYDVTDYVKTSSSLVNDASQQTTFTMSSAEIHYALKLRADKPSRARFYATPAQQAADLARAVGVDPVGDHGLLLEVNFLAGKLTYTGAPASQLFALPAFGPVPVTITNKSGSTGTVALTLTAKGV